MTTSSLLPPNLLPLFTLMALWFYKSLWQKMYISLLEQYLGRNLCCKLSIPTIPPSAIYRDWGGSEKRVSIIPPNASLVVAIGQWNPRASAHQQVEARKFCFSHKYHAWNMDLYCRCLCHHVSQLNTYPCSLAPYLLGQSYRQLGPPPEGRSLSLNPGQQWGTPAFVPSTSSRVDSAFQELFFRRPFTQTCLGNLVVLWWQSFILWLANCWLFTSAWMGTSLVTPNPWFGLGAPHPLSPLQS